MQDVFTNKVYKPEEPKPFPPKNPCKWQRAILKVISDYGDKEWRHSWFRYEQRHRNYMLRLFLFCLKKNGIHSMIFREGMEYGKDVMADWIIESLKVIVLKDWAHDNQRNALLDKLKGKK